MEILHLNPYYYAHIKDKTENIVYLKEGPCTYVVQNNEEVVLSPQKMIKLPPNRYIRIANPVLREKDQVVYETINGKTSKLARLRFGEEEVREFNHYTEPFSLFPDEIIVKNITAAKILSEQQALRISAIRDFHDHYTKTDRKTGDEYILPGPVIYFEQIEVVILKEIEATNILPNTALRLIAKKDFVDRRGIKRISGEEWLVREIGPYIPSAEEDIVTVVDSIIIGELTALTLEALNTFEDAYGEKRTIGDRWMITSRISTSHIPDVYEKIIEKNNIKILNRWQYCVIEDPMVEGRNQYGRKEVRKGETSFFLQPGEKLVSNKIFNNIILSDEESLLLICKERFEDDDGVHLPGERWMIHGPMSYVPNIEVQVLEKRKRIPLDDSEGIYVRDIHSGEVKLITGTSYLLKAHEELWEKSLPDDVELLLVSESGSYSKDKPPVVKQKRDKTRSVTFRVPHNSVVQVFDYQTKKNKVIFGPSLIQLGPYEQFTVLNLSGDNPKTENKIKSLILRLGPDYISDTVEVETSDHARLSLRLTYSWKFVFDRNNEEHLDMLFRVKDFVGDCTKSIASRIRGTVSAVSFDSFHKDSTTILQGGVFGRDKDGNLKKPLRMKGNNLEISNVDIQSQELVDNRTREILNKSMKLSMETNLKIQEAEAKHSEDRANQEAKGQVERKKIEDDTEIENKRLELLEWKAINESINTTGFAKAEAQARAYENEVNSKTELEKVRRQIDGEKIKKEAELARKKALYDEEIEHLERMSNLEIDRARTLADTTIDKITVMINALGKDTLVDLARAGPEGQAQILGSLGVKSLLVTDGKSPINLFNTANGLLGGMPVNTNNS